LSTVETTDAMAELIEVTLDATSDETEANAALVRSPNAFEASIASVKEPWTAISARQR